MKKLFRRKSSVSTPCQIHGETATIYSPESSHPLLVHSLSSSSQNGTLIGSREAMVDSNDIEDESLNAASTFRTGHSPRFAHAEYPSQLSDSISPNSDVMSVALSESETLYPVERSRLDLQSTYYENFLQYVPFLLRRVRLQRERAEARANASRDSQGQRQTSRGQSTLESVDIIDDNYSVATDTERESISSDDVKTLIGNPGALTADQRHQMPQNYPAIMGLHPTNYDYKRSLILVSELLKADYYVFADRESYELFKELKAGAKKSKKSSVILYDEDSKILKVERDNFYKNSNSSIGSLSSTEKKKTSKKPDPASFKETKQKTDKPKHETHERSSIIRSTSGNDQLLEGSLHKSRQQSPLGLNDPHHNSQSGENEDKSTAHRPALQKKPSTEQPFSSCVVDSRHHIVPIENKVSGKGLPLFKVSIPYMSSFRKSVPYMILKRYKEIPDRPLGHDDGDAFETYDFCAVQLKGFNHYKRYTFSFRPAGQEPFKVLAYQCNLRPFTDFKFKGTRFRIFGTSMATAYISNYNPDMKLFIVDENKPSLVDNIINKVQSNDLLSIAKIKSGSNSPNQQMNQNEEVAPEDFENPVPSRDNPILQERMPSIERSYENSFIPNDMPPFSRYTDASVYLKESSIVPKKFTEVGKFDIYQSLHGSFSHYERNSRASDLSSTYAVPTETLVLTSIFLALRETNLRTTKRYPTTNSVARMGVLATMPNNVAGMQ